MKFLFFIDQPAMLENSAILYATIRCYTYISNAQSIPTIYYFQFYRVEILFKICFI